MTETRRYSFVLEGGIHAAKELAEHLADIAKVAEKAGDRLDLTTLTVDKPSFMTWVSVDALRGD